MTEMTGISNEQAAELIARGLIGGAVGAVGTASAEYMRGGQVGRGLKVGGIVGAALGVLSGVVRDPRVKLAALSAFMAATAVIGIKKLIKPANKKSKCVDCVDFLQVLTCFLELFNLL